MNESIPTRQSGIADTGSTAAAQRLLAFADQQISKIRRYSSFNCTDGQPGFYELNQAMMDYQTVNTGLIAVNVMAKVEYSQAKEAFDDWFSEKYVEMRNELNPRSMASTKWFSTKEIEMEVRVKYRDEYKRLNDEVQCADHKVAAIRRLLDGWASQQFLLARLSKNVEAEYLGGKTSEKAYEDLPF
jgi:glutaredoxin-related protein